MNIQQLRYAVTTAETGSMTTAAARLYVAQPALSRAIRLLERELGCTFFVRSSRGVRLTADGEAFVARATRVLGSIDALSGASESHGPGATLVIAASPTLQSTLAIPLLAALNREAVVHTRMHGCSDASDVVHRVASGRADLGICDEPVTGPVGQVPIGQVEVKLYSPADVELPDRVTVQNLADVPLVVPSAGTERRAAIDAWFTHHGLTPRVAIETDERNAWLDAVRHGLASVIWHSVEAFSPTSGIRGRRFDPPVHQQLTAVHHPEDCSDAVRRLLDVLRELALLAPAAR